MAKTGFQGHAVPAATHTARAAGDSGSGIDAHHDPAAVPAGEDTFEGTFREGTLELAGNLYVPAAGYASELEMSGALSGDQFKGKGSWDGYALTIVGKRSK